MSKNNPTIPINITPIFTVNTYKDMECAYEIECSNTFKTYKSALKFFNKERKTAKGNYFIELIFCLEVEYKKKIKYLSPEPKKKLLQIIIATGKNKRGFDEKILKLSQNRTHRSNKTKEWNNKQT